ncbi:MAG: hypothetical protein ACREPK_08475 [Rhodanobacteraceae bacterium]
MKTTLELPDELMRAVKVRAATTDRKLKDVVAEAIARGLEHQVAQRSTPRQRKPATRGTRKAPAKRARGPGKPIADDALQAIFAAGDEMARRGVDFKQWAKHSRDVWR